MRDELILFWGISTIIVLVIGVLIGMNISKALYEPRIMRMAETIERLYSENEEIKTQEIELLDIFKGKSSWYGQRFHLKTMANGEIFDKDRLSLAMKEVPLGSRVIIVNRDNNKLAIVEVKDRGPYVKGRLVDSSERLAEVLGFKEKGLANIEIWVLRKE